MKLLTICALVALLAQSEGNTSGFWGSITDIFGIRTKPPCEKNPDPIFKQAIDDFTIRLTKRAAFYANGGNFVISPYSIWFALASIAEFTDGPLQTQYLSALNLPEDRCLRQKVYALASHVETSGVDVDFKRRRAIAVDERLRPYEDWLSFIAKYKPLEYLPIDYDEENFQSMREAMGILPPLTFYGNSILLDRLFYEGLWTNAFSDGIIEYGPFYNDLGQQIATVDYMKMKNKVRLAHIPFIDAKVLELPVGNNGRYTMLFTMGVKSNTVRNILDLLRSSTIVDILKSLTLSQIPIDVAIPRFFMHYGFNAKPALEDMGFGQIFSDPSVTRHISDPPALPSYFFQRLDVNVSSGFIEQDFRKGNAITSFFEDTASGVASVIGREFVANRPFFFSLIDTTSSVTIFTGFYAYPEEQILPPETWRSL